MERHLLPVDRIAPSIREKIATHERDIVDEVIAAIAKNDVVVVGMAQNPHPKRVRKALDEADVPFAYLEYGNYLGPWRRRNALKMWTGWWTFPMVFVKGTFVGGANETIALISPTRLGSLPARIPVRTAKTRTNETSARSRRHAGASGRRACSAAVASASVAPGTNPPPDGSACTARCRSPSMVPA